MELRDYLRILWGRKLLILLCVVLCLGSALAFSARVNPTYAASAKIFVGPKEVARDDAAGAIQELTLSDQFVSSYAEILKSRPLAELVVQRTNARISPDELTQRVETLIIPETRLIQVTVTGSSASTAARFANELVTLFVEDPDNRFGGGTLVTASVLEPALEPSSPVSPKPLQNAVVGGILGLMLGVGLAFVLEQLDLTLRTKEDVEKLFFPLPAIATIPLSSHNADWSIFLQNAPNSPESEAIRILRTNIQFYSVDQPVQRILITSTVAGEGKTTVAINLAVSIAATDTQVLLIEADLRRPTLRNYFPDFNGYGLTEVLSGQVGLDQAVWKSDIPNLSVLFSGHPPPNPSEQIGSERMADLLDLASTMAEIIIFDTPPSLPLADATALAPQSDGVVLVVRAGRASAQKALDVARTFERTGVRVLGVAVNALVGDTNSSYYYHYASVGARNQGRRATKRAAEFDDSVVNNAPSRRPAGPPRRPDSPRTPTPRGEPPPPPRSSVPVATTSGVTVRPQPPRGAGPPGEVRHQPPAPQPPAEESRTAPNLRAVEPPSDDGGEVEVSSFKARLRAVMDEEDDHPASPKEEPVRPPARRRAGR